MKWISIKNKVPAEKQQVLAFGDTPDCQCHHKKAIELCLFTKEIFEFGGYDCVLDATHWMPLPEPPKEKE